MHSAPCPTCRTRVSWEGNPYRPFCSDRCRVLDLAAWANERYRIAGDPLTDDAAPGGDDELD